jgi:hypothetical protein
MIRFFCVTLFFGIVYLGCCPGSYTVEDLEAKLSGFINKTYVGKLRTRDGQTIEFELQIVRDKTIDSYVSSWSRFAYAASCPPGFVGVRGTFKSTDSDLNGDEFTGVMSALGGEGFQLRPHAVKGKPPCHIFNLTISPSLRFIEGSYEHKERCGGIIGGGVTELKPK